jgi:dipeptidyl aminopeptidase/acylaminoacyl peptidase
MKRVLWVLSLTMGLLLQQGCKMEKIKKQEKVEVAKKVSGKKSEGKLPPIIKREILFGNPEKAGPQISPDGKFLAYLAPDKKNVLQVWVRTIGKKDDRMITADKKRGIRAYFWTYDKEHLIYMQDSDGDENWHLYAVNMNTQKTRDLTPYKGVRAEMIARNVEFPHEILVGLNKRDKRVMDAYRMDLRTGKITLDTENPGNIVGWEADARLQIRAANATTADGGSELLYREEPGKPFKAIRQWDPDNSGGSVLFSKDGKTLYIMDTNDANAERLMAVDLKTNKAKVVAANDQYDVAQIFIKPIERTIQAVGFDEDKLRWEILDKSIAGDFKTLAKVRRGEFIVSGRDLADKKWLVVYITDDGPVYYYLYDRPNKKSTLLFSNQPKLEGLKLAQMEPISYKAKDGLTIHGYLTVPVGQKPKCLPTVLLVHGGPWARDNWGYDPEAQWLANRGYAVLQVNFRGSTGYGKKHLVAGFREWAGKMHDDLIDGVNWIVKKGVADPKRIAIMGGSYGGYATLVGLTFTPDVFAAGVDIVGPSNIITLMKSIPPYWEPMRKAFEHRVGSLAKEEKFLKSRSPLFFVDQIQSPLLIGQGANDPRVKQPESEQIVAAMRKAKKPVEYVLFPDEGHGFARPENRLQFYAIAEIFLAKYLGGQCEPEIKIKGATGILKSYE